MATEGLVRAFLPFLDLVILALLATSVAVHLHYRRREEIIIRRWCDAKGYSVSRMQTCNTSLAAMVIFCLMGVCNLSLVATTVFWLLGGVMWCVTYRRAWRLAIYDNDGGEQNLCLRVNRKGQVEETSSLLII